MGNYDGKIFNPFSNTLLLELPVFWNLDVSIIYVLPSIMFATIAAGCSLATYLPLTFKPFKQGIAIKWVLQL